MERGGPSGLDAGGEGVLDGGAVAAQLRDDVRTGTGNFERPLRFDGLGVEALDSAGSPGSMVADMKNERV